MNKFISIEGKQLEGSQFQEKDVIFTFVLKMCISHFSNNSAIFIEK